MMMMMMKMMMIIIIIIIISVIARVCITSAQFSSQREQRGSSNISRTTRSVPGRSWGKFTKFYAVFKLPRCDRCGESKQAPTNTYVNFTLNDLHDT